jgi:phage FluMu protein Com
MPIRFRCAYCNQLLGISRRKAGTVVRCPQCTGQVVVPQAAADEQEDDQPGLPLVFERDNFDQLLNANESNPVALSKQEPAGGARQFPVAAPSAEVDEQTEAGLRSEKPRHGPARPNPATKSPLARPKASAVLVGLFILLAFGAGVWVGYSLKPATGSNPVNQEAAGKPAR